MDTSISNAIQSQSQTHSAATSDIKQAEEAIESLQTKIQDIAAKADRSERMVQVICADIRQLDHAKRHLQTTITALKRLHMLVNAVGQLEEMADKKQVSKRRRKNTHKHHKHHTHQKHNKHQKHPS